MDLTGTGECDLENPEFTFNPTGRTPYIPLVVSILKIFRARPMTSTKRSIKS